MSIRSKISHYINDRQYWRISKRLLNKYKKKSTRPSTAVRPLYLEKMNVRRSQRLAKLKRLNYALSEEESDFANIQWQSTDNDFEMSGKKELVEEEATKKNRDTTEVEHSPTRLMKNLTIEERHTLSLEESKKKRQQFENSLFLPNNKKRKDVLKVFNRKSSSSNQTLEAPPMDSNLTNDLDKQPRSRDSEDSFSDQSDDEGEKGDEKTISHPKPSSSSGKSSQSNKKPSVIRKNAKSIKPEENKAKVEKLRHYIRKPTQQQNPYPSYVSFRTKGKKLEYLQEKTKPSNTSEPSTTAKQKEGEGKANSHILPAIVEKSDEEQNPSSTAEDEAEKSLEEPNRSECIVTEVIDLTQNSSPSSDKPETVQPKFETTGSTLLRASSPKPFEMDFDKCDKKFSIEKFCQVETVQSSTHSPSSEAIAPKNLLSERCPKNQYISDSVENPNRNHPFRYEEMVESRNGFGPSHYSAFRKIGERDSVEINQSNTHEDAEVNRSESSSSSESSAEQQSYNHHHAEFHQHNSLDSTIQESTSRVAHDEIILQEVPSSSIPFQPFYLQRPRVYGPNIAPSLDLGRPYVAHQHLQQTDHLNTHESQIFRRPEQAMQPQQHHIHGYRHHTDLTQPIPRESNPTYPKQPLMQLSEMNDKYSTKSMENDRVYNFQPPNTSHSPNAASRDHFICPTAPAPTAKNVQPRNKVKTSCRKPVTIPAKSKTSQGSQVKTYVVTPICIQHPFHGPCQYQSPSFPQHPPSNIPQHSASCIHQYSHSGFPQHAAPNSVNNHGYRNEHRFAPYPPIQHTPVSNNSQFASNFHQHSPSQPIPRSNPYYGSCNSPRRDATHAFETCPQSNNTTSYNQTMQHHPNSVNLDRNNEFEQRPQNIQNANSDAMRYHFNQQPISYWDRHHTTNPSNSSINRPQPRIPACGPVDPEQWLQARIEGIEEANDRQKFNNPHLSQSCSNSDKIDHSLSYPVAGIMPEINEAIMGFDRAIQAYKTIVNKANLHPHAPQPRHDWQQWPIHNHNAPPRPNVNAERVEPGPGVAWGPNSSAYSRGIDRNSGYPHRNNASPESSPRMDVSQHPRRQQNYSHQINAADSTTGGNYNNQFSSTHSPNYQYNNEQARPNFYEPQNNQYNNRY